MSRAKLLIAGVSLLLLLVVATGGVAAADVDVDASPTDWGVESVHTVEFSVDSNDATTGQDFKNIVIDYTVGDEPADVSNVGTGSLEWVGIDRGGTKVGTRIDEEATIKEVTAEGDGSRLVMQTQENLQIQAGDEVIAVYKPVQNPQDQGNPATYDVNVTLNRDAGTDVARDSVSYEYNDASLNFTDQETSGESVIIDQASLSEAGYVVVLNESGQNPDGVRGSTYLSAGDHQDVEVDIEPGAVDGEQLDAQVHIDTNRNQTFDWNGNVLIDGRFLDESDQATLAEDSATLTLSPPEFTLSNISPGDTTVTEGDDPIDISVDVENTGGKSGTQDVSLSITNSSGEVVGESRRISLKSGGTQEISFNDIDAGSFAPGDYTYEISSDNQTVSKSLTVDELATFELSNLDPDQTTVQEGDDPIDISVRVDNTGDQANSDTLELSITDGSGTEQISDTESTSSLEGGSGETVTFTGVEVGSLDPGEYTYEVNSSDDTKSGSLTVEELEPPSFQVSGLSPSEISVKEGASARDIEVTVENTGDQSGSQTVDLSVTDGSGGEPISRSKSRSLDPGQSTTVTFSDVDVGGLEPGDYTYTVDSEDDSAAGDLSVSEDSEGPDFQLSGLSDRTVKEDDSSIDVSVDVENIGTKDDDQDIDLTVTDSSGSTVVSRTKSTGSLSAGSTTTVTFTGVDAGDPGDYTMEVSSDNDTDASSLTVEALQPATFKLGTPSPANAPVKQGDDPIDIDIDVENTGEETGEQTLTLDVVKGSSQPDITREITVSLNAGDTTTSTFESVDVGSLDAGEYTLEVSSDDDTQQSSLTVKEVAPATFELVSIDPSDTTVTDDADPIDISADIENTGDETGDQRITLSVTDESGTEVLSEEQTIDIDSAEVETVTFDGVDVGSLGPGEYTHTVASENDSMSGDLTVVEATDPGAGNFQLSGLSPSEKTMTEGDDPVDISVNVENTAGDPGQQDLTLTITDENGNEVYSATDEDRLIDGGNSKTVTFGDVPKLAPGEYTHTVGSANDTVSGSLTVEQADDSVPATFELVSVDPAEPTITEGEKIEKLAADIENTGDETGDQRIQLTVTDGDSTERLVTNQTIDIDSAEVETVEFNDVAVDGLEPGDYTYTVASRDDTISGTLTVEEDEGLDGGSGGYSGGSTSSSDESDESDAGDTADADDQTVPESALNSDTQPFEDQEPRSLGFNIEFDNTVLVEEITFEALGEGSVTVAELSGVPDDVEEPGAAVLETMAIDPPVSVEDDPATVSFTLNEAQLDNVDSVQLSRWTGSEWEHYDAERVESDGEEPTFAADVEGFSVFAVTTADSQNEGTDETGSESGSETDSTDETGSESGSETDSTDETASTDTPEEPVEEGSLGGVAPVIGIVVLILLVAVAAIAIGRETGQA